MLNTSTSFTHKWVLFTTYSLIHLVLLLVLLQLLLLLLMQLTVSLAISMPNPISYKPLATTHFIQASSNNPKSISSNVQNSLSPTPPTDKTSEVNSVQSTPAGKNKSKKGKCKNKEDKNNMQYQKTKTQPIDDKDKRKPRYPCLIFGDDHYTKDCPR
jgi:hypothetical protein